MMSRDNFADWSNAKRARMFARIIAHMAVRYGDHGVVKIPVSDLENGTGTAVGFDMDDGEIVIAVDMDKK